MTASSDAYARITEENLRLNEENIKLRDMVELQKTIYSELGIAFDDLKREKDVLEEKIQELAKEWRRRFNEEKIDGGYDICSDELEAIIDDKAGAEEAEGV